MNAKDRSQRLGRGLAALMGDFVLEGSATEHMVRVLRVDALRPGPFQPRRQFSEESLESLAASIRSSGIIQPVLVRPEPDVADTYQIIAGERRWRAAQLAGLHELPCLVRRLSDLETMAAGLVENLQRQDLNAIEEAEGYRRLTTDFGMQQDEVGQTVGKSRSHVANTLRLLALPGAVQNEVRTGALSAGHARTLLGHPDPQRAALVVIARGLNVRQTEAMVQAHTGPKRDRAPRADPNTVAVERDLSAHLGLTVAIAHRPGGGGTLRIDYADLDQLDGLIRLLRP